MAPANDENSVFAVSPSLGSANAPQASPGRSAVRSVLPPAVSATSERNGPSGTPVVAESTTIASPSACSEATVGPSLSTGRNDLNCSNDAATSGSSASVASTIAFVSTKTCASRSSARSSIASL